MEESAHPPHLLGRRHSSFIPFCAYKTSLVISEPEVWLPNISFPICTSFKPTLLEGQLCYGLQVNVTSGEGKQNGLTLLLDYQEDLSLHISSGKDEDSQNSKRIKNLNFDTVVSFKSKAAKVHVNTLSPFIGFGGGSYKMTAVKRMTAKSDFLEMPLEDRNCKVELYEDCRRRRLLEECECIPSEATSLQVIAQKL